MSLADHNIYLKGINDNIIRLLGQIDRNPISPTFGSCHRNFWHHKQSSFSSAIYQTSVHTLALAYTHHYHDNSYFHDPKILQLIIGILNYTLRLTHPDGSFDEWYPNERGWAGPTGYLIYALADTMILLGDKLPQALQIKLQEQIKLSCNFLGNNWEEHILFNHVIMALLALHYGNLVTNHSPLKRLFNNLLSKAEQLYNYHEGWGPEYGGADIGYETATLSFLARIHSTTLDKPIKQRLERIATASIKFCSYFAYPDYSFANGIGSRQTTIVFPFAFEYWGKYNQLASSLASHIRLGIQKKKILSPQHHEDHYLIYRIPEFLQSYLSHLEINCSKIPLPYQQDNFLLHFTQSNILINKNTKYYIVINIAQGGITQCYTSTTVTIDNEWFLLDKYHNIFTNTQATVINYTISKDNIEINGYAKKFRYKAFSPITLSLFNLFMYLFIHNQFMAYRLKSIIRKILMFSPIDRTILFKRNINLETCEINDELSVKKKHFIQGVKSACFAVRYVPQSRYGIGNNELSYVPFKVDGLNKTGNLYIKQEQ